MEVGDGVRRAERPDLLPLPVVREDRRGRQGDGLEGTLSRGGGRFEARVSLIEAAGNRMVWGAQRSEKEDALPALAGSIAQDLAAHLGLVPRKLFGMENEVHGGPRMAVSPELADVSAACSTGIVKPCREATERLVRAFPDEPDAWRLRLAAIGGWPCDKNRAEVDSCLKTLVRLDPEGPTKTSGSPTWPGCATGTTRRRFGVTRRFSIARISPPGTVADIREAIRLDPSNVQNYWNGSVTFLALGRFEKAIDLGRRSAGILGDQTAIHLGHALLWAGRVEESLGQLSKACARLQAFCSEYGMALSLLGRHDEALPLLAKFCDAENRYPWFGYAIALLRAGKRAEAEQALAKTASLPDGPKAIYLSHYYSVAGDKVQALHFLRRYRELYAVHDVFRYHPNFIPLRADPDFEKIFDEARKDRPRASAR